MSLAVFSVAATLTLAIISRVVVYRQAGEGYIEAVMLVDGFLQERRRSEDAVEYFFSHTAAEALAFERHTLTIAALEGEQQEYVVTNQGYVFSLACYPEILSLEPLVFRGHVESRWSLFVQGREKTMSYGAATIFANMPVMTEEGL